MAKPSTSPRLRYHVYRKNTWMGTVDATSADDAVKRFQQLLPLAKQWKDLSAFQERRGRA